MGSDFPIRIHPYAEEIRYAKWLQTPLLCSLEELDLLLHSLGSIFLVPAGGLLEREALFVSPEDLRSTYQQYLAWIVSSAALPSAEMRRHLTLMMSVSLDSFSAAEIKTGRFMIKPVQPVVMIQPYHFFMSSLDQKIHSMVMSQESISWGLQFSYPQMYEDPKNHLFGKISEAPEFPNTALYKKVVQWVRSFAMPAPVHYMGQKTHASFRIGKQAFALAQAHKGLQKRGIEVRR